ncbi:MAG: YebC/PmpR family DNA-binding transcriptional regulator, partial [Alphaproteobacteria bacterium]
GARALMRLLDMLDDNDDVQTVYGNYQVPDDIATLLEG